MNGITIFSVVYITQWKHTKTLSTRRVRNNNNDIDNNGPCRVPSSSNDNDSTIIFVQLTQEFTDFSFEFRIATYTRPLQLIVFARNYIIYAKLSNKRRQSKIAFKTLTGSYSMRADHNPNDTPDRDPYSSLQTKKKKPVFVSWMSADPKWK